MISGWNQNFRKLWFAVLVLLLACFSSKGARSSDWSVRAWQTDDGLPHNSVTSLAQTPDGYLWVVTARGLARFDGIDFQDLPSEAWVKSGSYRASVLLTARDGSLWFGT